MIAPDPRVAPRTAPPNAAEDDASDLTELPAHAVDWMGRHCTAAELAQRTRTTTVGREARRWDGKVNARAWAPRFFAAAAADTCCLAAGFWRRGSRSGLWHVTGSMLDFSSAGRPDECGLMVLFSSVISNRPGAKPKPGREWALVVPLNSLLAMAEQMSGGLLSMPTPGLLQAMTNAMLTLAQGGAVPTYEPRFPGDEPLRCLVCPELHGILAVQCQEGGAIDPANFAAAQPGARPDTPGSLVAVVRGYGPLSSLEETEQVFQRRSRDIRDECDRQGLGVSAAMMACALAAQSNPDQAWDYGHELCAWGAPDAPQACAAAH